jgi:alkylhydroperoxidase family enzyme
MNVLARANADFNAAVVDIDVAMIGNISWPLDNLKPMLIHLNGAVSESPVHALRFLLLMTSINYRFWHIRAGQVLRYTHFDRTGAKALWTSFENAWGSDDATARRFKQKFEDKGVIGIFGSIPDWESRQQILKQLLIGDLDIVSRDLTRKINSDQKATVADAAALAFHFPTAFGDPYLKKAQLALSMYSAYLRSKGASINVSDLTAFADYQVPRVLRALGILRYSESLAKAVDSGIVIPRDSIEELSIRAATILACEYIAEHCNATAADVDNLLWGSQDIASDTRFHLTETTWY